MIPFKIAQKIIVSKTATLAGVEQVAFLDSLGRVLAEDIRATSDLPPFDRATVDGFALRCADAKGASEKCHTWLRIVDVVRAGRPSQKTLKKGEAIKIMTGGVLPKGVDAVVMKEFTECGKSSVCVLRGVSKGHGISFRAESAKKGKVLLAKGAKVTSGVVSLLATLGISRVKVYRRPRVAILVTGNELLGVGAKLAPGKIRSSNQFGLFAQVQEAGGEPVILGIARDTLQETRGKILKGLKGDMLIISGGVSVGDFDLVPKVLKSLGVKIFIEKVSMQPGKPLIFGKKGKTYVFGLPGNPVSTMVCFYEFAALCLSKLSGQAAVSPKKATATLAQGITLRPARTKIMRGVAFTRNGNLFVRLTSHQGSGNILSLAEANCLFEIEEGVREVKKGTRVIIQYL